LKNRLGIPNINPTREECEFFHVIDLPGEEPTEGSWDFRKTEAEYHGGFSFKGKTVLEIGTATGSHAFWMEKQGASVTPYDLSPAFSWDIMATAEQDAVEVEQMMHPIMEKLNNGWYYCRNRLKSKLELSFGSIYDIPKTLGDFDVVTFGSVLLHTRNPIGALQFAADRAKEAVIIMDRLPNNFDAQKPFMEFIPKKEMAKSWGAWTWWWISPKVFENLLGLRGFEQFDLTVSKHFFVPMQKSLGLFTLVARRK
jgi:hypothetical protein